MAVLPSMWLFGLTSLIVPEYPFGIGWMSFTSAALSKARPFSSKNIVSSAKYFLNGSWFPGATESSNCWVRRTSSSCVMVGPSATLPDATVEIAAKNSAAKNPFLTVPSVPLHLNVSLTPQRFYQDEHRRACPERSRRMRHKNNDLHDSTRGSLLPHPAL